MAGPALYLGSVRHRREDGPKHSFRYRVWYALLDLDEIPRIAERVPFFSHNRFNLTGFDDRDHMGAEARPVREKLERWLEGQGVTPPGGRILVLTHLRVLGHVFNPISFFYCHDPEGRLRHVVAEVNNTFGETYCYLLHADGRAVRATAEKSFHVSPFQPVDGEYRFQIAPPGQRISIHIDVLRDGKKVFDSTLTETSRPFTSSALVRTALRHPHVGLWTLALIHYQALRLWLKRAPFHSKPAPPIGAWRTRNG